MRSVSLRCSYGQRADADTWAYSQAPSILHSVKGFKLVERNELFKAPALLPALIFMGLGIYNTGSGQNAAIGNKYPGKKVNHKGVILILQSELLDEIRDNHRRTKLEPGVLDR